MARILLTIEYDGTLYAGWQRQKNAVSVQQTIEEAIFALTGFGTVIHGAGRTDSGVHALAQTAHFDTVANIPAEKWAFALNTKLPEDIVIRASREAPPDFHARFSAKGKRYRYCMHTGEQPLAIGRNYIWHTCRKPDTALMQKAFADIVGKHDFRAFMAEGSEVKDTVREIYSADMDIGGEIIAIDITGSGFLYNMVRIIAGTALDIGCGIIARDSFKKALESKKREDLGMTAPAKGLTLICVEYD